VSHGSHNEEIEAKLIEASEYKALELWHKTTGSQNYFIINRQASAKEANAPLDAIYFHNDSRRWICVSDLAPDHSFRAKYDHFIHSRRKVD